MLEYTQKVSNDMKGQKDFNLNLRVYQAERDIFRSKGLVLGICIIERGQGLNRESQSFRTYSFKLFGLLKS